MDLQMTPTLFFRKIIVVFLLQHSTKMPFVILFSAVHISKRISTITVFRDLVIWTSICSSESHF